jgi:hypothetical protein
MPARLDAAESDLAALCDRVSGRVAPAAFPLGRGHHRARGVGGAGGVRLLPPAEPVTRQVFTVSRRGGDRKPAVRVVLDALVAAA